MNCLGCENLIPAWLMAIPSLALIYLFLKSKWRGLSIKWRLGIALISIFLIVFILVGILLWLRPFLFDLQVPVDLPICLPVSYPDCNCK